MTTEYTKEDVDGVFELCLRACEIVTVKCTTPDGMDARDKTRLAIRDKIEVMRSHWQALYR